MWFARASRWLVSDSVRTADTHQANCCASDSFRGLRLQGLKRRSTKAAKTWFLIPPDYVPDSHRNQEHAAFAAFLPRRTAARPETPVRETRGTLVPVRVRVVVEGK